MYNAHFNFREAPFGVTPDPQFYYSNSVYREAWATLRYGIESRKGFIVIAGEVGTGKTTLLRKAMHAFGSNIKTAYIPNPLVGYTDLLRLTLTDLGLPNSAQDRPEMIEILTRYLIEQFEAGNIVALLIDEAQNLSLETLEELRCLGNLETDKDKLLQIVLVGQPELEHKLDRPELRQLKQRVVLRGRLNPVGRDEVGSYMDSRLQTIGHRSKDLFDPDAIEKIAICSNGIPRLINIVCDNALLIAFALSKLKVSAAMIDEVAVDLRLRGARIERDVRPQALASPFEVKETLAPAPALKEELTTKDKRLFIDSGDRPADMREESKLPAKETRRRLKRVIGASAAVALLAGPGLFLYSHEWGFSTSTAPRNIASPIDGERKGLNRTELAASALGPKTSANDAEPVSPAAQIQSVTVSEQNVDATEQQQASASAAAEDKVPAQQIIIPEATKTERPPPADKEEKSANKANFLVTGPSFVRAKPTAGAAIIATLEPGTRITVAGRTGEYYQIRSLGAETIRGYVHKEDAFFERKS